MTDASLYDEDFYAWTQEQAQLLRRGAAAANHIDFELIAEEIEDLGKSELHTVQSLCEHIIEHLLKLEFSGLDEPVRHWRQKVIECRIQVGRKQYAKHYREAGPAGTVSDGATIVTRS